jgi:glutamyl-tRNA synthetase
VLRRFRFAPTPSRPLHAGSALAALIGWAEARNRGDVFILRIEDIDRARSRPEHEATCLHDLRWLGLDWDEGPDLGGGSAPYRQSQRMDRYDKALAGLIAGRLAYPCACSRADVRAAQSAPHLDREQEVPYPGTCRPPRGPSGLPGGRGGYRLDVTGLADGAVVAWEDCAAGPQEEDVRRSCGDFLLGHLGAPSYQLAVVVDDLAMGITDVVRGRDLLGSTARQILLYRALGANPPSYLHHPLLLDRTGRKLAKRDADPPIATWRATGGRPEELIGRLAAACGIIDPPTPLSPEAFRKILALRPGWHDGLWPLQPT